VGKVIEDSRPTGHGNRDERFGTGLGRLDDAQVSRGPA
jgi:hypothetical protein